MCPQVTSGHDPIGLLMSPFGASQESPGPGAASWLRKSQISIWLTFTRSNTPLEICRWFPQFVFTLHTRVRPIKVGILNRFLHVADDRLPTVLIKKKIEEDNS